MRILLVKPYWQYPYDRYESTYSRIWPPLSLMNCAALLEREGFEVDLLDAHALRVPPDRIPSYCNGYDKIFITSSSLDRWQCPNLDISTFIETVYILKKVTDEVYVMGYHGTVYPEDILIKTGAKAVVRGEPEYAVLDLCRSSDQCLIHGITQKVGDRIVSNPDREPIDLRELPVPAFHLIDFTKYKYEILGDHFALFELSRGCNFRCTFCNQAMYGEGLRFKTLSQIQEEVSSGLLGHDISTGYFIDLDFLSCSHLVEDLCDFLLQKQFNFEWACQTRADMISKPILEKMKSAGCSIIHIGVESSSQDILDSLNKRMRLERVVEAMKLCRNVGVRTFAFYLIGVPGETGRNRKELLQFACKLKTDFASFHKVYFYKKLDFSSSSVPTDSKLDHFLAWAFLKYYFRPSNIFRIKPQQLIIGIRFLWERIKTLL